ncbi:unnamed protein product, partial [Brachionus calyciflorus]
QLNRCLFESKCGGANRSWDFEFVDKEDNDNLLFRFVYVKNKSISETRKILNKNEIERPISQSSNHLCQTFHGNTITTCKYLKSSKYLLTGAEDTQLIISKITNDKNSVNLIHEFHLQGHDSVVKCIDYYELNENEMLLVSAGGKANIKIWKVFLNENSQHNDSVNISRITNLYEFKRKLSQNKKNLNNSKNEKPWLYVDLKSNPDIRFMDVCMFRSDLTNDDAILCFACSDGCIRIFRYSVETNKLYLVSKYEYPKCLLCIRKLKIRINSIDRNYLLAFGTDGNLLFWKINESDNEKPQIIEKLNQSGINDVDIWQFSESNQAIMATVGDDTCLTLTKIEVDQNENLNTMSNLIKFEMIHSSAIVGVKFILENFLATVSKDQRLIVWEIDYKAKMIKPVKVYFINVPDVSSMDLKILEKDSIFQFLVVGVGMEIINFKLEK